MAISGIGVIESGLGGVTPNLVPLVYLSKTINYQMPEFTANTKKVSSADEKTAVTILENQLVGISRAHNYFQGFVTFNGLFQEQSNYSGTPPLSLNVQVSGIEAYINRIYVGGVPGNHAWSGLSSTGTNYLWLSLVEQNSSMLGFLSSRQYSDFECRSTLTGSQPIGPEASVLVATYTSGTGLNVNPFYKAPFMLVGDHVANNIMPHGDPLNINFIQCSGLVVMGYSYWNYASASGAPINIPFSSVEYLNNLNILPNTTLITSGVLGNIQSGLTTFSFFNNPVANLSAQNAIAGNLVVISGFTCSGSNFRNTINVTSGITVDGLTLQSLIPLVNGSNLSGSGIVNQYNLSGNSTTILNVIPLSHPFHTHGLNDLPYGSIILAPKYPGMVTSPNLSGANIYDNTVPVLAQRFILGNDLGNNTLRHVSSANSDIDYMYIRSYVPQYFNHLESVNIQNAVDSGNGTIQIAIRDSLGNLQVPVLGNTISSGIGTNICYVSGLPSQAGFAQNSPFDIEFTFNSISGTSHYLGDIIISFLAQSN